MRIRKIMSRWLLFVLIVTILLAPPETLLAQGPDTPNWTYALEWSPDGSMIAVGTMSGLIRIVDAMGQPVITLQTEGAQVSTLAWSPDGTRLASAGGYGETTIWDVLTGNIVMALATPEEIADAPDAYVDSISWSPDGFYLGGVSGGGLPPHVFVWNMRTGQLAFTDSLPHAFALAWNSDSSRLAVGALSKIVIYDPITWQSVAQIETVEPEYITALYWSPY
jgi:WD40 repeat protein